MQVGKLKLVKNKKKKGKKLNANSDSDCNSFKKFSEITKNGRHAFKPLERILWVGNGLPSVP